MSQKYRIAPCPGGARWECKTCSAVIVDTTKHDAFHEVLDARADLLRDLTNFMLNRKVKQ